MSSVRDQNPSRIPDQLEPDQLIHKTCAFLPAVLLILWKRMHLILMKSGTEKTKVCVCVLQPQDT